MNKRSVTSIEVLLFRRLSHIMCRNMKFIEIPKVVVRTVLPIMGIKNCGEKLDKPLIEGVAAGGQSHRKDGKPRWGITFIMGNEAHDPRRSRSTLEFQVLHKSTQHECAIHRSH